MKSIICDQFQNSVDELLLKHKSILDIITKQQESSARINRAIIKAVTSCGCIEINSSISSNHNNDKVKEIFDNHLNGVLCNRCREIIEQELGNNFFYIAALCNNLDINMADVITKEQRKINTLGKFNMIR